MRTFTLAFMALLMSTFTTNAQVTVVATFDTLTLPGTDTAYVNYSAFGTDVGFDDGLVHFPCVYDTAFGFTLWSAGFAFSNKTDDTTRGYLNPYSAITASGQNNTAQYAVANTSMSPAVVHFKAPGDQVANGFYITNSTYAYWAIKEGYFGAKAFGGVSGNDTDWFKVTVKAYDNGSLKNDSVDFYLADYRFANNAQDYIVNDWRWVNLSTLGIADSLLFTMSSSDTAGGFGMNTPGYFCVDSFTTNRLFGAVNDDANHLAAKVYPNPATDRLYIEATDDRIKELYVYNMTGALVKRIAVKDRVTLVPMQDMPAGTYMLQLKGDGGTASLRFVKQ